MNPSDGNTSLVQNTTHRVVIPFYVYAALSFLAATVLLLFSGSAFTQHYFHPRTLAITHIMALGWGTMMILGASYQLVPVLIEAKLYSPSLAYLSFLLAGTGIPLLVFAFFRFHFGWQAQTGAILINAAVLLFLVNLAVSIARSQRENVHAIFVLTATAWLLITTLVGLLLVFNFTRSLLPADSLHYLSLHAHLGIVGWFLLLVMGVGSRLLPMFLISKYDDPKRLWRIFFCINGALLLFIVVFFLSVSPSWYAVPLLPLLTGLLLFGRYCRRAYRQRIRKQVDQPVTISLLSMAMLALPVLLLMVLMGCLLVGAVHTE
ncbi:MAG TPA: cytochrome C oxidase subunit I, partial [Flavisolibacter sp.]|nr:cytochrome C oxidase subunit I [Flavisolibacter sp.]